MLQDKLKKLHDQIPPNEISIVTEQLQVEFSEQKKSLVDEMEQEIESARN